MNVNNKKRKNKDDLISEVASELGLYKREVEPVVDSFVRRIIHSLETGSGIILKGLIELSLENTNPRVLTKPFGNNTDPILIRSTKVIKASVSPTLQSKIRRKNMVAPAEKTPVLEEV